MSYMLFMDESGHHGGVGYEVRGGIALPSQHVWQFTRAMRGLEGKCFGDLLQNHGKELKAVKLLEKKRVRLSQNNALFSDELRQKLCREYFGQARNGVSPTLNHNIAYAQAGCMFVDGLLKIIKKYKGMIFATVVPAAHSKPPKQIEQTFIRRDLKYLMRAYFYFCEENENDGILVLDETDRTDDRRYLKRLERYFSATEAGKQASKLVLPTPLFTESHMSYPVQAADIVCYLISKSFRLEGMDAPERIDLSHQYLKTINSLTYSTVRTANNSGLKRHYSIVYVENPWRKNQKGEGKTLLQDGRSGLRGRASEHIITTFRPKNSRNSAT
jgi:hypothetical protein